MSTLLSDAYPTLRRIARARLRRGRHLLPGTNSLVHESYIRLAESGALPEDRTSLLLYSARAMRSIVVDSIRRRFAERRGGGREHVEFAEEAVSVREAHDEQMLTLDRALRRLETVDPRLVRGIEMRYFGGFTESEIAEALGVTERTVRRDWEKARLLLAASLS